MSARKLDDLLTRMASSRNNMLKGNSMQILCIFAMALAILTNTSLIFSQEQTRWSEQKANDWYLSQPWLVGANFIPSNAINQLEMFQAETFDPAINDHELGLA
jgi:hypothetical protein